MSSILSTTPCKGCDRRVVGCHSVCGDYIAWRKAKDDESLSIREGRAKYATFHKGSYEYAAMIAKKDKRGAANGR